ncbi:MAG: hypothetical protein R6V85_21465 [Polyangia bacterium]
MIPRPSGAALIAAMLGCLSPLASLAESGDDFVPVDPASLETVSGSGLAIAAYSVILGLIALYALSIWLRSAAGRKRAKKLAARLDEPKTTD